MFFGGFQKARKLKDSEKMFKRLKFFNQNVFNLKSIANSLALFNPLASKWIFNEDFNRKLQLKAL